MFNKILLLGSVKAGKEINLVYPFTTNSSYLSSLVTGTQFIINSSFSAITNGTSSYNVNSGTSYGNIEFTTPSYSTNLIIEAYVSSESNYDYGIAYLGSVIYKPTRSQMKSKTLNSADSGSKYIFSSSGNNTSATTYTEVLVPSKKYVVSFGYAKDGSANRNSDRLIIKRINFFSV